MVLCPCMVTWLVTLSVYFSCCQFTVFQENHQLVLIFLNDLVS